jgi:hypothetical protein
MSHFLINYFQNESNEFYLPFSVLKHTDVGAKAIVEKIGIRTSRTSVHFCQFHTVVATGSGSGRAK